MHGVLHQPAGSFQHLRHLVERPDAGALVPHEVGDARRVVVVDVGDEHEVDVMHAVGFPQFVQVVDDESAWCRRLRAPSRCPCAPSASGRSR